MKMKLNSKTSLKFQKAEREWAVETVRRVERAQIGTCEYYMAVTWRYFTVIYGISRYETVYHEVLNGNLRDKTWFAGTKRYSKVLNGILRY